MCKISICDEGTLLKHGGPHENRPAVKFIQMAYFKQTKPQQWCEGHYILDHDYILSVFTKVCNHKSSTALRWRVWKRETL